MTYDDLAGMGVTSEESALERRVAELDEALRKSEARFRALIEHSVDVTAIVDAVSRIR
jgi:PAS domain-containing protein